MGYDTAPLPVMVEAVPAVAADADAQFQNKFSTHLCDCYSTSDALETCLISTHCPCVQFGRNVGRLGIQIIPHMIARKLIREKYGIKGNACGDCCTVFWCTPCALCQEHRQLQVPVDEGVVSGVPVSGQSAKSAATDVYTASGVVTKQDGKYYSAVATTEP